MAAAPSIAHALRGRAVLVVHEDPFRADYLAAVLRAAGAVVGVPVHDGSGARRLIEGADLPHAIVLSSALAEDAELMLVRLAIGRDLATLVVQSARARSWEDVPGAAFLATPHAGFQVVEAVARLLAAQPAS